MSILMSVLYILLAIVVLLFMVLIHEFGHYTIGRMLNFKITEFSVGFGKALLSRKNKRGELISLRLFPLGGYCAFAGEEDGSENDPDAFVNQKPWKRILVFLAGVTFNFATAVIFSLILLCTVGYDIPQINEMIDTTPTSYERIEKVNGLEKNQVLEVFSYNNLKHDEILQENDVIISINGKKIDFAYGSTYQDSMSSILTSLNNDKDNLPDENYRESAIFSAVVKRNGEYINVKIAPYLAKIQKFDKEDKPTGEISYIYVCNFEAKAYVHSFGEALKRAVPFAFGLAFVVLKSLWLLITFQLPLSSIGGPITTIATIASFTRANAANLLSLIPLISANLAIFNILPIPALDGSHVLFTTIEAIRKKPIKREIENMIHTIGLFILFGAVILIDILHFVL